MERFKKDTEVNYWPSFTDAIIGLLMMFLFFFMIVTVKNYFVVRELRHLKDIVGKIEKDKADLEVLIQELRKDNIQVKMDKNQNFKIILGENEKVIFPTLCADVDSIPSGGRNMIRKIGKKLKKFLDKKGVSKFSIMIEGYTDTKGQMKDNYVLSYKRAKNIMVYLSRKCRLDPDIYDITPVGFGELKSKLASYNKRDDRDDPVNRRVEIRIIPKFPQLIEYLIEKEK